ncbi:SWI/SNF complex subunit SWI3A-like isoform X5 [Physcomitrium patens]|uniref:SWI/SNF complex subunit SWI3A-like isoform X5 n=1 Tax=Physcomitrium patens TaxID=3218 RepID=UPI003CCE354E
MSEFFDKRSAAKTPRMYKECRDFTINRCRENLKQAVTFQEVALLAGAVGPRVASAAAQAAVAAIAEDEPGVWEVPFMRRSKVVSEEATSEKWGAGHPRQPDAAKAGAGGEELPCAVQARVSVATALGVAAANAKLLADGEEREIEHLVASIIDYQMKKLYSKLEHFEELGMLLEKERVEVERARQQVYAERLRYAEAQTPSAKALSRNPAPRWRDAGVLLGWEPSRIVKWWSER